MLDNTSKWSHPRGNTVVPSRWQATSELAVVKSPATFIEFLTPRVW